MFSAGCFLKDFTTVARPQLDEPEPAAASVKTIGDVAAEFDNATDADLFVVAEGLEPAGELVGALDVPRHGSYYAIDRIMRRELYSAGYAR